MYYCFYNLLHESQIVQISIIKGLQLNTLIKTLVCTSKISFFLNYG